MPKNICVDLNIILDFLLQRPGGPAAQQIFKLAEDGAITLHISAHCVTTLFYLLRREKKSATEIQAVIGWLLAAGSILPTDKTVLAKALGSLTDYEDAVIEQAAVRAGCEYIVTRNVRDFRRGSLPAVTPEAYLKTH